MPADLNRNYSHRSHIYSNARDNTYNDKNYENFDSWDGVGIYRTKEVELSTVDVHSQRNSIIDVPSQGTSTIEVYSQVTSTMDVPSQGTSTIGVPSQKNWPLG
jgi:hypothetical protein